MHSQGNSSAQELKVHHFQQNQHDRALEIDSSLDVIPRKLDFNFIPTVEEKKESKEKKPEEPHFYYLKMDDAEFADFRKTLPEKFQKITKAEAEILLEKNKGQFKTEYVLDFAANATNALFPVWLVKTGASGFILCASLLSGVPQDILDKDSSLKNISTFIVWASSLLATAQWMFMYTPWTEATKATLHKATEELTPLLERIKNAFSDAWEHPSENVKKALGFLAFQFLTKLINITAASTEIFFSPAGATWIPAVLIIFLAARYCSQVWDASIQDGWKFWVNSKDHTSLLSQIKEGNYAIAFKTLFEGLSATILKSLQYFFIAEGNQELFGAWAHPLLVMTCGLLHGLLINYPTAFKNSMVPLETLSRLLDEKIGEKVDHFIDEQIKILNALDNEAKVKHLKALVQAIKKDLLVFDIESPEYKSLHTSAQFEHRLEKLILPLSTLTIDNQSEKAQLKKQILQFNADLVEEKILKAGRFKLMAKDPLNAFTVILNTLFGGYAGYKLLSPALSAVIPAAASIPVVTATGALAVGGLYYRAVSNTEAKKAVCEELKPELRNKEAAKSSKLKMASFAFAAGGALSSGLSAIGAAGSSVKDSTAGIAAVVFASTQKMINDARYTEPYILSTLKSQTAGLASYFKKPAKPHASPIENKTVIAEDAKDAKEVQASPVSYNGVRFWADTPKMALALAGEKTRQLTNSINLDRIRFWKSDEKPVQKEDSYIQRNKFEI